MHIQSRSEQFQRKFLLIFGALSVFAGANAFAAAADQGPAPAVTKKAVKSTAGKQVIKVAGPAGVMVNLALEGKYPAPIAAMVAKGKGVSVLDVFPAPGGLIGFVVLAGNGEKRIYYVTPDGTTAIYGLAFDEQLNNITATHVGTYTHILNNKSSVGTLDPSKANAPAIREDDLWTLPVSSSANAGAASNATTSVSNDAAIVQANTNAAYNLAIRSKSAFVEGRGIPVYIVFDLACPYCHKVWQTTRTMLNQLELHWIPVAALGPKSHLMAETFFKSSDRNAALQAASQRELKAANSVTPEVAGILAENLVILDTAKATSVPLLLYIDRGQAKKINGAPSAAQFQDVLRASTSNQAR